MSAKCKKTSEDYFILGLTLEPYLLIPTIALALVVINIPYIQRTNDWSPVWAIMVLLLIYSWFPYVGTRYRIWWEDGKIFQRTGDMIISSLAVKDIQRIQQESSDLATLAAYNRPSRRITLYGETVDGPREIYVSLIHFKKDDVKKLMRMIHDKRPDLKMPKGWG